MTLPAPCQLTFDLRGMKSLKVTAPAFLFPIAITGWFRTFGTIAFDRHRRFSHGQIGLYGLFISIRWQVSRVFLVSGHVKVYAPYQRQKQGGPAQCRIESITDGDAGCLIDSS